MSERVVVERLDETGAVVRWLVVLDRDFNGELSLHCQHGVVKRYVPKETLRPVDPGQVR